MPLPKVLIISQPFNNDTGGGITLSNLFAGWDQDKVAVVCTGHLLEYNIDTSICNTYYQLGYKEQKWIFPFNLIRRKYPSGILKLDDRKIQNLTINKSRLRVSIIMKFWLPFLKWTGLSHFVKTTSLSVNFCKWLDAFKPDIIYAQAEELDRVSFCLLLQNYLKKPMIFHMMDDWPSIISDKGFFKNYWQRKIDKQFRKLLNQSSILMSICNEMSNEYKSRYSADFIPFHNPVDISFWKQYQKKDYNLSDPPSILYAGRVGLGIDTSLELIAKAVEQVNKELNTSLRFVLQTQAGEKPAWISDYTSLQHQSFVSYNELPKVFSEADILVLPYDFSEESIKYIKYSMPTKASEYMVCGTPIIVFAPGETAISRYAQECGWAKVIRDNNCEKIAEAIKHLIQDKSERMRIAKNAIHVAERNHNALEIRNEFKKTICSLFNDGK
ncbi:glycosyltransferase family 4 protein [Ilyomonas limi]|uniref:Glycosyltransferase family 4 protein n=1 Tax=Ilyomonas limi TaxID=2575867 RepID=A0A4V5UUS9_9BACT|nr:glycosyltransferase [Ilyomonas limi]TKK70333.1 glycosyltransferase family 4 protein [Ilyomonas limi]